MKNRYSYERRFSRLAIYSPEGVKIAEVCAGAGELDSARLIVRALNYYAGRKKDDN